ncbi:hypothetical protein [Orrella sp. 11846]|uniref:hypothetical protein n=1 Tax=Orrella sp. 11846 TaxID=3409913 RepID=UPI003B5B6CE0
MKNFIDLKARLADEHGTQALDNARRVLVLALNELDRHIDRYNDASDLQDKADSLNWALGHLTTFVPSNVRLDMLAGAQAELASAAVMTQMAQTTADQTDTE